jgi:hypothetical protein
MLLHRIRNTGVPDFATGELRGRFLQRNSGHVSQIRAFFATAVNADGAEAETDAIEELCRVWTQPERAGRTGILFDAGPSGNYVGGVSTRGATVEVEAEGGEVTRPVEEPMTATTP